MASFETDTDGGSDIAAHPDVHADKSQIQANTDRISELYASVARFEGKLTGVIADARATDRQVEKLSNMLDLVSDSSRDSFRELNEQV